MNEANLLDLARMVATEHGKAWNEAQGDVLKLKEAVEVACGIPSLMQGKLLMNASVGYDTTLYHEPLGVFAGISPFNFLAMIQMGWMMPLCNRRRQHAGTPPVACYPWDVHPHGRDVV